MSVAPSTRVTTAGGVTSISLLPETLNLKLYAGDGVNLILSVTDGAGDPLDLLGPADADPRGAITAQIRKNRKDPTVMASFLANMGSADVGIVTISLSATATSILVAGPDDSFLDSFTGVWDVQWTPAAGSGQPITLVQGGIECVLDVTRAIPVTPPPP